MVKMSIPKPSLRACNNYLTVVVVLLALYILLSPFLPQITWWLRHDAPVRVLPAKTVTLPADKQTRVAQDKPDSVLMPSISLEEPIYEGNKRALSKGVWRLPHTSTPDKGGNTVLVGHRFTYAGSAVFYHLDKITKGDRIGVYWQGKLYEYEVFAVRVVEPDETSVEANTKEPRLTLYTCTPLWSVKQRLVIQAKLVGEQS